MTYKIPVELIKDKAPKTKKPKNPITENEIKNLVRKAKASTKMRSKMIAEIYKNFVPTYYEKRKPLERTTKRKRTKNWNDVKDDFWDKVDKLRKEEGEDEEDELRKTIVDNTGRPIKAVAKKTIPHNLEDLKRIKGLKDEIEALKTRIVRKDAMIKNLKRKVEKLKDIIESPVKEEQRQLKELVDNPDFLEIN
jgi:hypothetical protein